MLNCQKKRGKEGRKGVPNRPCPRPYPRAFIQQCTEMCRFIGKELRESRLQAPPAAGAPHAFPYL